MAKVILTFDDGYKSHFELVRPLLKKFGFTGTFFITGEWLLNNHCPYFEADFMTPSEVKQMHDDGFEIGNHCYVHKRLTRYSDRRAAKNVMRMKALLSEWGIESKSFSYPGYFIDDRVKAVVRNAGVKYARSGCEKTLPYNAYQTGAWGSGFEPDEDDLLAINCTAIFGRDYLFDNLRQDLEKLDDKILVLCFHDFNPETFHANCAFSELEKTVEYLSENGFQSIRLTDCEQS